VGSVRRRLEALERKRLPETVRKPAKPRTEEQKKEDWLRHAKARRFMNRPYRDDWHVEDLIRLLLRRGNFDGMDLEGFRGRLRQWRPPVDEAAIDRVTAWMAHEGLPPATDMECPPVFRESFEAAATLRERIVAVPPEDLAEVFVALHDAEEGARDPEHAEELLCALEERWGLDAELQDKAIGPDAEEVSEEERMRRVREVFAELYYGELGYRVQQHITRLVNEERSET
jgi:hypothetical protein